VIVDLNSNDEFASSLLTAHYSFETVTSAIMIASIIPVLIIYPYAQKYFTKGILLGGVKE
ncbi:MAG: carbohydrate ABC transporter permease, partial [Agrobacterium tumefaciens]